MYSFFKLGARVGTRGQRPGRFTPSKRPRTHYTGGWVGPMSGLDGFEKSRLNRTSIAGMSSHYTV